MRWTKSKQEPLPWRREFKIDVEASCFPTEYEAQEGEAGSQVLKAAMSWEGKKREQIQPSHKNI
jgi:hypothetical protein